MSRFYIPITIDDSNYILDKDVVGFEKCHIATEEELIRFINYWNNFIIDAFRELWDMGVDMEHLLPAVQDGESILIYSNQLALSARTPSYKLDMATGKLYGRGLAGMFDSTLNSFCMAWNSRDNVSFMFNGDDVMTAVVNGTEMSLENFEELVNNSDRYLEKVEDFLV